MSKIINRLIIGLFVIVISGSCSKILDTQPTNSLPSASAFSTADKCQVSLYGVYDAAQSGLYTDGNVRGYPFGAANIEQGDARGEDVVNVAAFFQVTYQATYNATTANNVAMWNTLYALINKANVCIDGFRTAGSGGVLTPAVALQYEAECRFLRAMAHHEAVIMYARPYADNNGSNLGVPYRDFAINTPEAVDAIRRLPRTRVDSVYKKALADLDFAEANLPVTSSPSTVRATKAAAIALKMRLKLHMEDWAGVLAEGAKLVGAVNPLTPSTTVSLIGPWALTASPDGPFTNNSSTESIFSIKNDALDNTGTNGALPSMYGAADQGARGLLAISPIIWNNNSTWLCDDKRRALLYNPGVNSNGNNSNIFSTKYRKYGTREDFAPQIRFAEVFLNMAEAEARSTGTVTQRAVDLLNMVRNRSLANIAAQQYTIASFADNVALVKAILWERRIEFLAEGKRWGDIHRNALNPNYTTGGIPAKMANGTAGLALYGCGTAFSATQVAIPYSDFKFIWPIPSDEIIQNPIIAQNPFY